MLAFHPTGTEPDEQSPDPQTSPKAEAERRLRGNPYLALKNVSCGWLDGVLVLRGCLPSYYLKQIAQEAVAGLEGVQRIDNQIQVVTPASPSRRG
jgi:osmotically-inducible protein OsmY